MRGKIISILLAVAITAFVGLIVPMAIDDIYNSIYGNVTLSDEPALAHALQDAQAKGVVMGIYGGQNTDYSALSPAKIRNSIESDAAAFKQCGLTPAVYLCPYVSIRSLTPSMREAIESTGVPALLPPLETNDSGMIAYGQGWGDMKDTSDPRYAYESQKIGQDQPTSILLNAGDWSPGLVSMISGYLSSTYQKNITVRIDNIGVSISPDEVYGMTALARYPSVGRIVYGIAPSGTYTGGDPVVFGQNVNTIMMAYWWYFILTALLPISFLIIWRFVERDILRRRDRKTGDTSEYLPKVSVIIPAYNEEKEIGKCLNSVLDQDYKGDMEIIIVNDGSDDGTSEIISGYAGRVKLIDLKRNVGKANALNIGIKVAKGDIIVFSDSDSYVSRSAISSLVKGLGDNPDAHIAAGNVFIDDTRENGNLLRYFQMIEYRTEQEINRYLQGLSGRILVCPGPLFAVRREVTDQVRFNARTVVEDSDFTIQALKFGMKIIWVRDAKVYTSSPDTPGKWYRQRKRWWFGNLQVWKLHRSWAIKNPWMVFNYLGFATSVSSIAMMLMLPVFLFSQGDIFQVLIRGVPFMAIPIILLAAFIAPLFRGERKLLLALLPYIIIYTTLKICVVCYIYVRYLGGSGVKAQFGPQAVNASWS